MQTFQDYLKEKLQDDQFSRMYEEDRQLVELALRVHHKRRSLGFSQSELAAKAGVTQQQLSRIENGVNCNLTTFLKVCAALDLEIDLASAGSRNKATP